MKPDLLPDSLKFYPARPTANIILIQETIYPILASTSGIEEAYACLVSYDREPTTNNSVCLTGRFPNPDELGFQLTSAIRGIIPAKEYVDFVFLTPRQRNEVASICKPFYRRGLTGFE